MSLDFQKIDASLFAIEGFLSRWKTHGDNIEHLDFYLVMASELRTVIKNNRPSIAVRISTKIAGLEAWPDEPEQSRRVRGPMSKEQKKKISNSVKRRNRQKKLGMVITKKFSRSHRKNLSLAQKLSWDKKRANAKKSKG